MSYANMEENISKQEPEEVHDFTIKEEFITPTEEHLNINIKEEDVTENVYEDTQIQIKEELTSNIQHDESQNTVITSPDHSLIDNEEGSQNSMEIKEEEVILPTIGDVKQESEGTEYDYGHFEDSMDSSEAAALTQVEACLEDEYVKTESEAFDNDVKDFPAIVKDETELTVTETHLISNKVINTTSTITNTFDGIIESQTTKTLIMEIHPLSKSYKMGNPEEILPTDTYNTECDEPFQLNSITGNYLSLEQEAYSLLQTKHSEVQKIYKCDKCPKICQNNRAIFRHKKVHEQIERMENGIKKRVATMKKRREELDKQAYEEDTYDGEIYSSLQTTNTGILKIYKCDKCPKTYQNQASMVNHKKVHEKIERMENGIKKRLATMRKNRKELDKQDYDEESNDEEQTLKKEDGEGYHCSCGKIFKRRSRMETCLRSHSDYSEEKYYPCASCDKKFNSKELLVYHRNKQHRKKYPCKFCPIDYQTQKELFKHLQVHQKVQLIEYKVVLEIAQGDRELQCLLCTETCSKLADFKTHIMEGHKEPYVCPHCEQSCAKLTDFASHARKAHPDLCSESVLDVLEAFAKLVKAWKCEDCGQQFHKADKLALHQVEEHAPDMKNEQHFQCEDCHRVFVSLQGLNSHRRMHHRPETSEEPEPAEVGVMCLECRKMCADMNALTSHMRLHSMDRKYPCKYCDFRFTTPQKRKAHAEVHTGDMRYVCFICEYTCSSENRLKRHKMSIKHLNMKEYLLTGKPLIEEEPTSSKEKIKSERSVKKRKKDSVVCDICGEKFSSDAEMEEHKQTHPFIEFPNEDRPSRIFFK